DNHATFTLLLMVVVVAALYLAQEVLIPLAMAVLLTFVLAPGVTRLERLRVPRGAAIAILIGASFAVLASVVYVVGEQVVDFTNNLPTYQSNIVAKVHDLKLAQRGPLARIQRAVDELSHEISRPAAPPPIETDAAAPKPALAPPADA